MALSPARAREPLLCPSAGNLKDAGKLRGPGRPQATVYIADSKTDQEGAGQFVGRECVCTGTAEDSGACPLHILETHVKQRTLQLAGTGGPVGDAPCSSTEAQRRLQLKDLTFMVEATAEEAEEELEEEGGRRKYGSHSLQEAHLLRLRGGQVQGTVPKADGARVPAVPRSPPGQGLRPRGGGAPPWLGRLGTMRSRASDA